MNNEIATIISKTLRNNTDKRSKDFWSKYLKNEIEFIGVGIPKIRDIVNEVIDEIGIQSSDDFLNISYSLMLREIAEDKLAAIILLQEHAKVIDTSAAIRFIDKIFSEKLIFDWNTCDWLCVRLLTPIIDSGNINEIKTICSWHEKEYLWHARASLVPFAQAKNLKQYLDLLHKPMLAMIKRSERFSKTAVGWVLREISKFNKSFVNNFLVAHAEFLTNEIINNASKYYSKEEKVEIKNEIKATAPNSE